MDVGSRTLTVRRRLLSHSVRFNASVEGSAGEKERGEGGSRVHSSLPPLEPNPNPPVKLSDPVAAERVVEVEELADAEGWWVWIVLPFRRESASRIMEWRRRSWEDMKGAEWRSPVQRAMSMQSSAWFRRVRRFERGASTRGSAGDNDSAK